MNITDNLIIAGFILVMIGIYKAYDLITIHLIDKNAKKIVNRILSDVQNGKVEETILESEINGIITLTGTGFQVKEKSEELLETVHWNRVTHIFAYKKDLGTTDLVCLGWKLDNSDQTLEVHEDMLGFKKLNQAMLEHYKSIPETWAMDIYFPAFETNLTLLWPQGHNEKQDIIDKTNGNKTEKDKG